MTSPTPAQSDETQEKLLLVKKILELPVRADSSALQKMDAWAIADFIAAEKARIFEAVEELLIDDPIIAINQESDEDLLIQLQENACNSLRAELRAAIKRLREEQ